MSMVVNVANSGCWLCRGRRGGETTGTKGKKRGAVTCGEFQVAPREQSVRTGHEMPGVLFL